VSYILRTPLTPQVQYNGYRKHALKVHVNLEEARQLHVMPPGKTHTLTANEAKEM